MRGYKPWIKSDEQELIRLCNEGNKLTKEIATQFGRAPNTISTKLKKMGITNKGANQNPGKWNCKYEDIREKVFIYFLTHSKEECLKKFKLNEKQFKSIMTNGYKRPELMHYRKETRDHSPWTTRQLKTLLQNAGLKDRNWIANKIKRGNAHSCIKERLEKLGVASRTLNGMTMTSYISMFGKRPKAFILTKAGPRSGACKTPFKIVPWIQVKKDLKSGYAKTTAQLELYVEAMSMFQLWIHQGKPNFKLITTSQRQARTYDTRQKKK